MKKIELLSPAGSFEALEAAIMCGADAVYLGGTKFGARAFASNFDNDNMKKAVNFAHLYGVRIYVTVNTLVYDNEVTSFLEYITFLNSIGVDAFIIQDIGMLHLLSTMYPKLELHASTQMHIHNIEALIRLKELGVKRAVLPRELSIAKIAELKKNSGMDIEIFVHGALCVSYSGQCLMSSLIGGRSGNRGECAGSCRLPYELVEIEDDKEEIIDTSGDYILSPKDLNTLDNIGKIIDTGVDSLKIEGRMKRPEYVALVTTLYRKAIDSYYDGIEYIVSEQDITDLKKMFNRGFTKGYLFGEKGNLLMNPLRPNHMGVPIGSVIEVYDNYMTIKLTDDISIGDGIRIISDEDTGFTVNEIYKDHNIVKEAFNGDIVSFDKNYDINIGDIVVKTTDAKLIDTIKGYYQNNNRKISLTASITGTVGDKLTLTVTDGINEATVKSEMDVTSALNNPVTEEKILEKLNKIGDTPYIFAHIDINIDDNIFIPLTAINAIKREALDKISDMRMNVLPNTSTKPYALAIPDVSQSGVLVKAKVRTKEQYLACKDNNIDQIYIENYVLYQALKEDPNVVLALPRVRKNKLILESDMLVGDFGAISSNMITDYSLNVVNAYTVAFMHFLGAKTVTLSYEMNMKRLENLIETYKERYSSAPNLEVIVYGRVEAMISEYCPLSTYLHKKDAPCNICRSSKKYCLRDRFHNDYVLLFDNCVTSIYNYDKRNIMNELDDLIKIGVNNIRFNFVDEDYAECSRIIKQVRTFS